MKKNYIFSFMAASLICGSVMGQGSLIEPTMGGKTPISIPKKTINSSKAFNQFYIDYDYGDEYLATDYKRFIWALNTSDSTGLMTEFPSLQFNAVVSFDSILDSYNNGPTYIPGTDFTSIRVDSIFAAVGHSNVSGTNDTIVFKIVSATGQGYPQPNNVLNTTTIVTNSGLSSNNDWLSSFVATTTPNFTMSSSQKWAVVLEYKGAPADTFGVIAGFDNLGQSGQCTYTARKSFYFGYGARANSYSTWWKYKQYGTLPTSNGANIYYDCNGNGSKDQGDSESYIQNWAIWVHVTTDPGSNPNGLNELNKNVSASVYPNPAKDLINLVYSLNTNGNVIINIKDITGRTVYEKVSSLASGTYKETLSTDQLNDGIYFFSVYLNGELSSVKKFTVNK